jgi:hypothetical protein
MLNRLKSHVSYANVVSTLCLFLLLGGGAYAVAKLGKNTVGSKQIKAKAVKTAELANNAVTSPKVKDGSLLEGDFAADQLPKADTPAQLVTKLRGAAEPWQEVAPGSSSGNLCADPANVAVFCSHQPSSAAAFSPWQNFGGFATAAFYKDQLGILHLRGVVSNISHLGPNTRVRTIFRLPSGYRPDRQRIFASIGRDAHNGLEVAPGRIDVGSDGSVYFSNDCTASLGTCSANGAYVTLDGISFRPDE